MSITVIDADLDNERHQQAILKVLDSYANDPMGMGHRLDPEIIARVIPGLKAHPTTVALLALDGDEVIGSVICFIGFSTYKAQPLLNIHDLSVLPKYRGQGYGRQLLKAVEEKANELGCCKVTLEVRSVNERAYQLYKRYGFENPDGEGDTPVTYFMEKRCRS